MCVEALCVGENINGRPNPDCDWAALAPKYTAVGANNGLSLDMAPQPFVDMQNSPVAGVHLHWALPKAFSHGSPPRAKAVAEVKEGIVSNIAVIDPGAGYTESPAVVLSGGGGGGATATATISGGKVVGINLTNGGSGYKTPPNVQVARSPETNVVYPAVPNRWFVLRSSYDAKAQGLKPKAPGSKPIELHAWVVESDFTSPSAGDDQPGNNPSQWPILSSSSTPPTSPPKTYQFVGRQVDLESWLRGSGGEYLSSPITAEGPGDLAFAAFAPSGGTAFGLIDTDPPTPPAAGDWALSYMVIGWFADLELDPLRGAQTQAEWAAIMARFGWAWEPDPSSSTPPPDPLPAGILCQGVVQDVKWRGPAYPYTSGVPEASPEIAVGNTSAEAFAAYLTATMTDDSSSAGVGELFEAFQYGLLSKLDQPDGLALIAAAVEDHSFGKRPGGSTWRIAPIPEGSPGYIDPKGQDTSKPFPKDIGVKLDAICRQQVLCNDLAAQLVSNRWELYSNWYLWTVQVDKGRIDLTQRDSYVKGFRGKLTELATQLQGELETLKRMRLALSEAIGRDLPGYELTSAARPAFRQPNDLVLLLTGLGRSAKYAHDSSYLPQGELFCRSSEMVLTGLRLGDTTLPIDANDLQPKYEWPCFEGFPSANGDVPSLLADLFVEALLLDPGISPLLAKISGATQGSIEAAQEAPWKVLPYSQIAAQKKAEKVGFQGSLLPSVMAVNPWQQAWSPLFLEWQVQWSPSYPSDAKPAEVLAGWSLELDVDASDPLPTLPRWKAPQDFQEPAGTLEGYTILSPHAGQSLAAEIILYLDTHKDDSGLTKEEIETLRAIAKYLRDSDILCQAMSGLHDQLIMQNPVLMPPPCNGQGVIDRPLSRAVGDQADRVPLFEQESLFSVRAGQLALTGLRVVDSFGQTKVVDLGSTDLILPPRLSSGQPGHVLATPRVTQPLRLDLSFLSASDDTVPTNSDPATSPLCGWLIPNHLDETLLVFDYDGTALGIFKPNAGGDGYAFLPVPGNGSPQRATNHHMKAFLDTLSAREGSSDLSSLIGLINDRQTRISPASSWRSQSLAVLVGSPLALVRASLDLELEGSPAMNQYWEKIDRSGANDPGVFPKVPFPVWLGNTTLAEDGLIGAFVPGQDGNTSYSEIYAAMGTKTSGDYVRTESPLALSYSPTAAPEALTLLMDPRCGVNAYTGMLPPRCARLQPEVLSNSLQKLQLSFFTGPLISQQKAIEMYLPGGIEGGWEFAYRKTAKKWTKALPPAQQGIEQGFPANAFEVLDGWLNLSFREEK